MKNPVSMTFRKLVIATHNAGKLREMKELLAPMNITLVSAGDLGLAEPIEDGKSFAENAQIKARAAAIQSKLPALADDSGLVVPALDGAPGIYSARWAGPGKNFKTAMARIERELKEGNIPPQDWKAYFVCVLSLSLPDGTTCSFEGRVHGILTFPPRGTHGFGYDPIFIPNGEKQAFGEMEPAHKHTLSHRARAFEKFLFFLKSFESLETATA